ncbi:MAG: hypothetical protein Q7R96_05035 [Nanoarchaeota archaeon]|nr:hypothetical protein [Nanoarchaeota archaeon]
MQTDNKTIYPSNNEGKNMSEERSSGLGCLSIPLGIGALVATFTLGPIDFGRSVYNGLVGDTPVLKQRLAKYTQRKIEQRYTTKEDRRHYLERAFHIALDENMQYNPLDVSIEALWDASEDYASEFWEQHIWPTLK